MMRNARMISAIVIVIAFGVFASPVSAQGKTCSLLLNLTWVDKDNQTQSVDGARAVAVKVNSRRPTPAVLISGQPNFPRLTEGLYRFTITKRGFRRAVEHVHLYCARIDGEGTAEIRLEPGSISKTMFLPRQTVIVGAPTVLGSPSGANEPAGAYTAPTPPRAPISFGVLNGKALSLPKPVYPPIARQAHVEGVVTVRVTIDEQGNVISARAVSGHPLLQGACVEAARNAKFSPTKLEGQPVKVTGLISYNFVAQ